jgi:hypothetical protein
MTQLGIWEVEAGNRAEPESQLRDTLPLTGSPHGKTEPRKAPNLQTRGNIGRKPTSNLPENCIPPSFGALNGKSMGFWWVKWLYLNGQTIERMERIKTSLRSVGSRTYGKPDERCNPSDSGKTARNCAEVIRKTLLQSRV